MPRDRHLAASDSEPCAETKAMRPDTGLNGREREMASDLIKCLMRIRLDHLPGDATLSEADKMQVYAEAAHAMSADLQRPVTPEQIKLVAANIRTANSPPRRYTAKLLPDHHAILKAQAEAEDVTMTALMRRILGTYFELPQET